MRLPRCTASLVLLTVCASAAAAQMSGDTGRQQAPEQERTLLAVRDSADRVRAELALFQRDLQMAGAQTVQSRARRLSTACEGLHRALTDGEPTLTVPASANEGLLRASRSLQAQLRETRRTLARECEVGLGPEGPGVWADSLKAWGPYRTSQVQQSLSAYDRAAAAFARAAGIELKPRQP